MMQAGDPVAGENPQPGASIHYHLPKSVDQVSLQVLDANGLEVKALEDLGTDAGMHRTFWDLRYETTTRPKLRTQPLENSHIHVPAQGWRRLPDGGPISLSAPPGLYTLKLTVKEGEKETVLEQNLNLWLDPASKLSAADLERQYDLLFSLRDMAERSANLINEAEWLRKQLDDLEERLKELEDDEDADRIFDGLEALRMEIEEVEGRFFDLRLTGASQDTLRWKRLLWAKISQLTWHVSSGDYPPTDSQVEVHQLLQGKLADAERRFSQLLDEDLASFRQMLQESPFIGPITVYQVQEPSPGSTAND